MKIAIGADHRGFELKTRLISFLKDEGHNVLDFGTDSSAPCDYPLIGYKVAKSLANGECRRGILICMSGMGMSMIANKVPGVRAAICDTAEDAKLSREHNDANVLCLGGRVIGPSLAEEIVLAFLAGAYQGGRHARRIAQIEIT